MPQQFTALRWTALAMLAALYIGIGALDKILGWNQTVGYIAQRGLPWAALLAAGAICVEVLAPLALFVPRWRAAAFMTLAVYTLATALMFHDFWRADSVDHPQLQNFFKNLALTGSLLYMFAQERMQAFSETYLGKPRLSTIPTRAY